MRNLLWVVLLLWYICPVAAQREALDSLKGRLEESAITDSVRVDRMLELSEAFMSVAPDSAMTYAREALELAKAANYPRGIGYANKRIGLVNWSQSNFESAEAYFKTSLQIFEDISDTTGMSNLQSNLGAVYLTIGNDPKALEYLLKSVRNAEVVGDTLRMGTVYINMGSIYSNDPATYEQTERSYLRALEMFQALPDAQGQIKFEGLAIASANLGELFLKREQPEKAIPYLRESATWYRRINGDVAASLNWLAQAYLELNQYDRSEATYREALQAARDKESKLQEARALNGLGQVDLAKEQFATSIANFEQALERAREIQVLTEQRDALKGIAEAYAGSGDYRQAFQYQQQYEAVRDSLATLTSQEALKKMQVQFETERKEKEIELLNASNELSQLQIEKDARSKQLLYIILGLLLAIFAGFVFQFFYMRKSNRKLAEERNRSEHILLNILPKETAEELKENGYIRAKEFEQITVLFTDFKAFSVIAQRISAEKLVRSVDYYFKSFDEIISRHNLEKIKTIGDAYMCGGGLPSPNATHARDAIEAAIEILEFVRETELNPPKGVYPFKIRIGLNSGPVVAGVVGIKKFAYDIWGSTVNVAARMESSSVPGKINVSENTYQILKDDYTFEYRGEVTAKNDQLLKMYFLVVPDQKH